jgi:hypothetical protein
MGLAARPPGGLAAPNDRLTTDRMIRVTEAIQKNNRKINRRAIFF